MIGKRILAGVSFSDDITVDTRGFGGFILHAEAVGFATKIFAAKMRVGKNFQNQIGIHYAEGFG